MPEVILDGEPVRFEGPVPESPKVLHDAMFEALAGDRKSLIEYIVDGQDCLVVAEELFPTSYEKVEAKSATHDELLTRLVSGALETNPALIPELQAYSSKILVVAWSEIFRQMDEFIGKVKPLVDLMDNLQPYAMSYSPEWKDAYLDFQKKHQVVFEQLFKCFQRGDVATLSDVVDSELLPLFEKTLEFLNKSVLEDLKAA